MDLAWLPVIAMIGTLAVRTAQKIAAGETGGQSDGERPAIRTVLAALGLQRTVRGAEDLVERSAATPEPEVFGSGAHAPRSAPPTGSRRPPAPATTLQGASDRRPAPKQQHRAYCSRQTTRRTTQGGFLWFLYST
jgi:hypothetical protein